MQKAKGPKRHAFRDNYLAAIGALALVLCSFIGQAQVFQRSTQYGNSFPRLDGGDSVFYFPTGCGRPSGIASLNSVGFGSGEKKRKAALFADTCGHHVYWFNWTDSTWRKLDSAGSGGSTDTTSLSNRINQKLNLSDTASMLAVYLRSAVAAVTYYPLNTNPAGYLTNNGLPAVVNALQVINAGGAASWASGTYAARPIAGISNRFYAATDSAKIYFDNGSTWLTISGGGGTPTIVWGGITGTLSTQTDLQATLDLKLAKASNLADLNNAGTARTNLGLGTSAVKDVAPSGNASSSQVVQGNDTRLLGTNNVTNSNLATMPGHTYKGVNGGSTATPSDITTTQLTADLNPFTTSLQGMVPSPGGTSSGRVLQDDGSWHSPAGGISQIKVQGPYLRTVGTDSIQIVLDSVAGKLGMYPNPVSTGYQWSYDNFWSSTTSGGFTVSGVTASLSGNKVQLVGTGNTYAAQYFKTQQSYLEHWTMEDTLVINNTISSTTYGVGLGMNNISNVGFVDLTNTGSAGKVSIETNGTTRVTSSGAITFANGDTLILKMQRQRDTLLFTATDKTSVTSASASYIVSTAFTFGSTDLIHKIGNYTIFVKGGTYVLLGQRVTSQEPIGAPLAIEADSKGQGYFAGSWNRRYGDQLNANFARTINLGSSGDLLVDVISRIQDIITLHPQQVLLQAYSNTLRSGGTLTTTLTQFDAVKGMCEANGIKVWITTMPETGSLASLMTQFDSAVRIKYPNEYLPVYDKIVACGSPCMAADGIHLTGQGNDSVYTAVIQSKKVASNIYNPAFQGDNMKALNSEGVKTLLNVAAIGGNASFTGTTGAFKLGSTSSAAFTILTNSRSVVFNWTNALPRLQFLNSAGSEDFRIHGDSLGNIAMGNSIWSSALPSGSNNIVFGKGAQQFAAASVSNNVIVGAFGNGGLVNPTTSGMIGIGFQPGYWDQRANRLYLSFGNTKNLVYGVGDSGRVVINAPFYSTLIPANTISSDNLQVNGSSYTNGAVKFKGTNIPDASSSTDSLLFYSHITGSGDTTGQGKKAAIGSAFSFNSGVFNLNNIPSAVTAVSQTSHDSTSKVATDLYVDRAVAAAIGGGSSFYQTVQINTSSQTQRAKLNFGPQFAAADNSGNGSTDISLTNDASSLGGAYLPTVAGIANTGSVLIDSFFYQRSGRIVRISGYITVVVSANNTETEFTFTLPIASTLGANDMHGQVSIRNPDGSDGGGFTTQYTSDHSKGFISTKCGAGTTGTEITYLRFECTYKIN